MLLKQLMRAMIRPQAMYVYIRTARYAGVSERPMRGIKRIYIVGDGLVLS